MSRPKKAGLEYRRYELPADFPLLALTGDHWRISPVPSPNLHIHNCMEIGLCHSDSGTMLFNGVPVHFEAGYVSCIARDVPHVTWSSPGEASLWSYLFIDPEAIVDSTLISQFPKPPRSSGFASDCHLMLSPSDAPWAAPLVRGILQELVEKPRAHETCAHALCEALITRLLRVYSISDAQPLEESNLRRLVPALNYISKNYMQDFPQETLAELCSLSPTHFRRLFKEQIGVNPLAFLHQTRIEKSCTLLRSTSNAISTVSEAVGYTSLSCFNRHFLEIMGCSPSAWRRHISGRSRAVLAREGWLRPDTSEALLAANRQLSGGEHPVN